MTDNELLLSISNMMDQKIKPLDSKISSLDSKVSSLEKHVSSLDSKVSSLEKHVSKLENEVLKINLSLENELYPGIKEIKSCYLSTFERYKNETEKIDCLQMDMDIVKGVQKDHSEKLLRIS